jgi:hypothetical protein
LMTHDEPCSMAPDDKHDLISGTCSHLPKVFRGELTADWRAANPDLISGDNSAAALLARIQAERAAVKPRKNRRV